MLFHHYVNTKTQKEANYYAKQLQREGWLVEIKEIPKKDYRRKTHQLKYEVRRHRPKGFQTNFLLRMTRGF